MYMIRNSYHAVHMYLLNTINVLYRKNAVCIHVYMLPTVIVPYKGRLKNYVFNLHILQWKED